jgi:chemotaxis protein MotA
MDLATVIGFIGGTVVIFVAIFLGGEAVLFVDVPSVIIVLGGTVATSCIKHSLQDVKNSITVAMKAFISKMESPEEIIAKMVAYAKLAKKEGLISLDQEKPKDDFMAKALRYLSDGYDEQLIGDMLDKDMRLTVNRHLLGQNVFKGMGDAAPAFGMIGTLIGLVQMLSSMSDPSRIGPSMAVALLTTLYGALIANVVCLPLADKLAMRSQQEQRNKSIIREAAVAINQAVSPMVLEESLKIYLAPKSRNPGSKGKAAADPKKAPLEDPSS